MKTSQVSSPRTRRDFSYSRPSGPSRVVTVTGSGSGTYTTLPPEPRLSGFVGHADQCDDVVTPGFRAIISSGGIVNNPFVSIRQTMECGGVPPTVQYTGPPPSPWTSGWFYTGVNNKSLLHANAAFQLPPFIDVDGNAYIPEVLANRTLMSARAKTSALAKVDQSVAQALVALAEARQTLAMVRNPLAAVLAFTRRFSVKRIGKKWQVRWPHHRVVVGDGPGLVEALANQYLAWYYGARPLLRDIQDMVDAYILSAANHERLTARSGGNSSHSSSKTTLGDRVGQWSTNFDFIETYTEEISFRTGILYQPTPASLQKTMGLRWTDIPAAVWDIIPWSFAVDYFSNMGKFIRAISPNLDVRYLACWDTYSYDLLWESRCTAAFIQGPVAVVSGGTEWATRRLKATVRVPSSPYSGVAPVPRYGDWSDFTKIGAVLSLIIQQLSGLRTRSSAS